MAQSIGIFNYQSENNNYCAKIKSEIIGEVSFNICRSELSFSTKNDKFELIEENKTYIKKKYFSRITEDIPDINEPEDRIKTIKSIILYQDFLRYSPQLISENNFIPCKTKQIIICQCFIELLEENNLHIKQYRETYIKLLELNFKLAEENYKCQKVEKAKNDLYYALRGWSQACMNYSYTYFEEKNLNREEEIKKAIFDNGKIKKQFLESKDERFQNLLRNVAKEWFLKSKFDMRNAGRILWRRKIYKEEKVKKGNKVDNKRELFQELWLFGIIFFLFPFFLFLISWTFESLRFELYSIYFILIFSIIFSFCLKYFEWANMLILRMAAAIIVGYSLLIITSDVWKFSLLIYKKEAVYVDGWTYTAIILIALFVSFLYLLVKIYNSVKILKVAIKRAISLFLFSVGQSFIIGLILFDLFAYGMIDDLIEEGVEITKIKGVFGYIYPYPLMLYASLALVIGIIIQMIWEDKPITETI